MTRLSAPPTADLESYVDAYEAAQQGRGRADPADFLPPPADPLYLPVLRELARIDLDYAWARGRRPAPRSWATGWARSWAAAPSAASTWPARRSWPTGRWR